MTVAPTLMPLTEVGLTFAFVLLGRFFLVDVTAGDLEETAATMVVVVAVVAAAVVVVEEKEE